MTVTWTSQIYDIVAIAVIVENAHRYFQKTTFIEWNETEVSIVVDHADAYNVTVVVYDRCRESHTSDIFPVPSGTEPTPTNAGSIGSLITLHSLPSMITQLVYVLLKQPPPRFAGAELHPSTPECVSTPSQTFVSSSSQPSKCDNRGEKSNYNKHSYYYLRLQMVSLLH